MCARSMRRCYDWRALRRIARALGLRARPDPGRVRWVLKHGEVRGRTLLLLRSGVRATADEWAAVHREQGLRVRPL
jgi:hypothetical protein